MTDKEESTTIWVVIGNGMTWGKGYEFKEALANMLKNESRTYPSTHMNVYRFDDVKWSDITVGEMGSVSYPHLVKGEMKKMLNHAVFPELRKAFTAFDYEVDELENSDEFYRAFDD